MEAVNPRVSFADLQRMPDDGNRYELYDGELCVVPAPLYRHQIVARRLFEALLEFERRDGGRVCFAPLDIVLSEYNVVQPDVMYFGRASAARLRPNEYVRFPPDLAIEVLSPSTASRDRGRKRDLMSRYEVPEYWVVDSYNKRIEVSSLASDGYGHPRIVTHGRCAAEHLRGFDVDLHQLFEGLDD